MLFYEPFPILNFSGRHGIMSITGIFRSRKINKYLNNLVSIPISFRGPNFFNILNSESKNIRTVMSFKYKLKDFVIHNYIKLTSSIPFLFYFLFDPTLVSHLTERLDLYMCDSILSILGGNLTLYKPPGVF